MLILLLACAWPSSAPVPSQPLIVETSPHETSEADRTDSGAEPDAGPQGSPWWPQEAKADPGVGGGHAD